MRHPKTLSTAQGHRRVAGIVAFLGLAFAVAVSTAMFSTSAKAGGTPGSGVETPRGDTVAAPGGRVVGRVVGSMAQVAEIRAVKIRIVHRDGTDETIVTSGATQKIKVRQGDKIDVLNASMASATVIGNDYVVTVAVPASDNVEITFVDLFLLLAQAGGDTPPPVLVIGDWRVASIGDALSAIATAAGEPAAGAPTAAGGGGEVFGLIQVVSWLLDRLGPVSSAQAAPAVAVGTAGQFAQMKAQILIAREAEIAVLAKEHADTARSFLRDVRQMAESGRGTDADVNNTRVLLLQFELELRDAKFRLALAADAHENEFGERLESTLFPVWKSPPPTGLDAITRGLTGDQAKKLARTYWRQSRHARKTLDMVKTLVSVAQSLQRAYRQQFALGRRTVTDLASVQRLVFETRVQQVARLSDLRVAESWILAARGQLTPAYIKHPGRQ